MANIAVDCAREPLGSSGIWVDSDPNPRLYVFILPPFPSTRKHWSG